MIRVLVFGLYFNSIIFDDNLNYFKISYENIFLNKEKRVFKNFF